MAGLVAFWNVQTVWNKTIARFEYKEKAKADQLVDFLNERNPKEKCFVQLSKEPMTELPSKLLMVAVTSRRFSGNFRNKVTGEDRRWIKVFNDIETTTIVMGKFILTETFTTHIFRDNTRIIMSWESLTQYIPRPDDKPREKISVTREVFEEYARRRWPEDHNQILIRLNG